MNPTTRHLEAIDCKYLTVIVLIPPAFPGLVRLAGKHSEIFDLARPSLNPISELKSGLSSEYKYLTEFVFRLFMSCLCTLSYLLPNLNGHQYPYFCNLGSNTFCNQLLQESSNNSEPY